MGASAKSATPQTAMSAEVARQIADIIPAAIDKRVQITLRPEELGLVRLSVAVSETWTIVSILAARAETLDLMRRNIDQLQRDFQTSGFGTAEFSFQSEAALSGSDGEVEQDDGTEENDPSADDLGTINIQTEGLDIRL